MNIRDIKTKVVLVRTMSQQDKDNAMDGMVGAQMKWFMEELGEFYQAIDLYQRNKGDIRDVAEETIGLFRLGQMFPSTEVLLQLYIEDIYTALVAFDFKLQYHIYREKKLLKGQGQDFNMLTLQAYIKECCTSWLKPRRTHYENKYL